MISICQRTLEPAFDPKNYKLLDDELNRLFRSSEFNVSAHIKNFKVTLIAI